MRLQTNRRDFLKTTSAVAAAGAFGVWSETPAADSKSPNEKLNIAFVGVANKGGHNVGTVCVAGPTPAASSAPERMLSASMLNLPSSTNAANAPMSLKSCTSSAKLKAAPA